jgi:hypothetical protein
MDVSRKQLTDLARLVDRRIDAVRVRLSDSQKQLAESESARQRAEAQIVALIHEQHATLLSANQQVIESRSGLDGRRGPDMHLARVNFLKCVEAQQVLALQRAESAKETAIADKEKALQAMNQLSNRKERYGEIYREQARLERFLHDDREEENAIELSLSRRVHSHQ